MVNKSRGTRLASVMVVVGVFCSIICSSVTKGFPSACQDAKRNARETLVYAYPCHQPYSTPNTIGPRGTSWRVATSGVHASKAFLERYSRHIGFSYIILSHRVFLMFVLHRVFLVSARMRKETVEKRLYTRTHATYHIAHPIL